MKKIIAVLLASLILFSSCADSKTFQLEDEYITIEPYGFFSLEDKVEGVDYDVSVGNVVWAVILCETIIAPIIICGWYLFEPDEVGTTRAYIIDNKLIQK